MNESADSNEPKTEKNNKVVKRISMDSNRIQPTPSKPKFNSFMVPKSQFLHGTIENEGPKESSYINPFRGIVPPTTEPFSSYKSHLTINSSANMFSREQVVQVFNQLSNGQDVIRLETLKAYLFEIGQREDEAVNMISLLDSSWEGTVKFKDFERFLLCRMTPNREDPSQLPQELRDKAFRCRFIEQNFDLLRPFQDPDYAARMSDEFDKLLSYP